MEKDKWIMTPALVVGVFFLAQDGPASSAEYFATCLAGFGMWWFASILTSKSKS